MARRRALVRLKNARIMQSVSGITDLRRIVGQARNEGRSIGFVPTMGALHAGHASLIDHARRDGRFIVVSIFVNPLQFNDKNDFVGYPVTEATDTEICRASGVDLVFRPEPSTIYPDGFQTHVVPGDVAGRLEGRHRAGHFDGVATVVLKLFNMVAPDAAYFGRKDFQQLAVVRRMVRDLDVPIEVIGCPTIRESDGLALSSRNVKLSKSAREVAPILHRSLRVAAQSLRSGASPGDARSAGLDILARDPDVVVDYLEIVRRDDLAPLADDDPGDAVVLVAATIGGIRLIDNLEIEEFIA